MSTALRNDSASKTPFEPRNFMRLSEARLHAVSSRNMYSEHGLDALIRPVVLQVCQRFTVVSYCMPGSPQCHAESDMRCSKSLARNFSAGEPSFTLRVHQSRSSAAACMNSSVTRTE